MFDTLNDLGKDVLNATSCQELVKRAWDLPLLQRVAGTVVTGICNFPLQGVEWGMGCRCDSSIIYVRSYPKGRFGMPLQPNELRVLVTCSASLTSGLKTITIVRLFLASNLSLPDTTECSWDTKGALSVPLMPVYLFEDHITDVKQACWIPGSTGYHLVAPGFVTVHETDFKQTSVCSHHTYVVAGSLMGVRMHDVMRKPVDDMSHDDWKGSTYRMVRTLTGFVDGNTDEEKLQNSRDGIAGSRMLCESISAAGMVDLLASDVVGGALADPLSRTEELPLLLAVVTRIAANPHRYDLLPGTKNDVWAAGTVATAFEANHKPALVMEDSTGHVDTLYAIDVVTNYVLSNISTRFSKNKNDREVEEMIHRSAMEWCLRVGYQLCVDAAAPSTHESLYTSTGFTDQVVDAVTVAHDGMAHSRGMGRLSHHCMPPRQVNRARRQCKILQILDEVDEFLSNGRNPSLNAVASEAVDSMGYSHVPRFKRGQTANQDPVLCAAAVATARRMLEQIFFRGIRSIQSRLSHIVFHSYHPLHTGPVVLSTGNLETFVCGNESHAKCADCDTSLHVLEAFTFTPSFPKCTRCGRRRCWECGNVSTAEHMQNCLRCMNITSMP